MVEEHSNKNVAEETSVAKVNKTIVEVKGAEVEEEHKARSRSSSSSSSSSEDESNKKEEKIEEINNDPPSVEIAHNTQTTDELVVVSKESVNDIVLDPVHVPETKIEQEEKSDSSSSSSDEDNEKEVEKPKSDNEIAVEVSSFEKEEIPAQHNDPEMETVSPETVKEINIEIQKEIEEDTEEEFETKRKASLIQAEVNIVPEPDEPQEEKGTSSSSSSSSSDNEEEESTNIDSTKVEEIAVPSVIIVDEDCPVTNDVEEVDTPITVTEINVADPGSFTLI